MSGKSAGQLAYEAGGGAIHSYERIQRRARDDLPPAVREGYEAAAAAVETEQVRLARQDRDQLRGQVLSLAADPEESAARTAPSKKTDIENATAARLRKIAEPS